MLLQFYNYISLYDFPQYQKFLLTPNSSFDSSSAILLLSRSSTIFRKYTIYLKTIPMGEPNFFDNLRLKNL